MRAGVVGHALIQTRKQVKVIWLTRVGNRKRVSERGSCCCQSIDIRRIGRTNNLRVAVVLFHNYDDMARGHKMLRRSGLTCRWFYCHYDQQQGGLEEFGISKHCRGNLLLEFETELIVQMPRRFSERT